MIKRLSEVLTVARTTAGFRATAASHIAAAGVRTALTPAHTGQDEEQDATQDYNHHKHPLCNKQTNNRLQS